MRYLGIDLGSSFIKGAVLDTDALTVDHVERLPFPEPINRVNPLFREFNPDIIIAATRELLERLVRSASDVKGILMCSQLHGLVFTTEEGKAVSNLINWQDQRALMPLPEEEKTYFEATYQLLNSDERRQLGNEPRPGTPLCFLRWLSANHLLPDHNATAASLPNFVVANLCQCPPKSDLTNAFAHGALNVETRNWHREVIEKLGLDAVRWPEIVPQGTILGETRIGSRLLPIFAPIGDYQCSQVGALIEDDELSINISTGSAVIRLSKNLEFGDFQTRPFFDGRFVKTITHIPGGRALAALVKLLGELAEVQGMELNDPWTYILNEATKVSHTDLKVNPAFYFSAMGSHGEITNVKESNLSIGHLFRATFSAMVDNYARCAEHISPDHNWRRIVFSGGVAMKIGLLREMICERLGKESRLITCNEDTLFGLLTLALAFTGKTATVADAMVFMRNNFKPKI